MTGYGRGETIENGITYTVEVKSVNHRYFEFSARVPRGCAFLEEKLKTFFSNRIARGKIEVYVGVEGGAQSSGTVRVNEAYADSFVAALRRLKKQYGLAGKVRLSDVAANSEVFVTNRPKNDEDAVWKAVSTAAAGAIDAFVQMRALEGEKLAADICGRCEAILERVSFIETRSPETLRLYRERLEQKMREVLADTHVDEQRILTEAAIFADKIAVDEETVRLRSHISQLQSLVGGDEAVGRKLDFVVQEMNREANTIGSKAQDIEIAHTVVEIKAEIEKIREQIQNIE